MGALPLQRHDYPCQGKGSSPSHLRYLFLQCLGCTYLSNSRTWLHLSNDGFALFAELQSTIFTHNRYQLAPGTVSTRPIPSNPQPLSNSTCWLSSPSLSFSYWKSREQKNNRLTTEKNLPTFIPSSLTTPYWPLSGYPVVSSLKQLSKFLIIMAMRCPSDSKTNLLAVVQRNIYLCSEPSAGLPSSPVLVCRPISAFLILFENLFKPR